MRFPFSQGPARTRHVVPPRPGDRARRRRRAAMLWLAGFAAAAGAATSEPAGAIDIRALPTLVAHWERSETRVEDVVVDDGVAYARAWRDIEAIDIASGRTLWTLSLDQRIAKGPVLLDDRLAVIIDERTLVLVDRVSGLVAVERPLPGKPYHGSALAGPPLVAAIQPEDGDGIELLRLDDVSGHELDRLPIDRLASLRSIQGTTVASFESEGRPGLVGFRGRDLTPTWEHPIVSWELYAHGDRVIARVEDPAAAFLTIDSRDGTLGTGPPRWPRSTAEEDAPVWILAWDLEVVGLNPPVTLRRLDPGSGRPLWEIPLPCDPSARTRDDDRLVLDCRPADRGRSLLLVIDLATGAILRRAPGFHGVSTLETVDDLGLAASHDGLVAFSLTAEGPAIAETLSIEHEVDALLTAARQDRMSADEIAADLSRIGDAALPLLARKFPALDDRAAQGVASVLGDAAYSPAANVVGKRLRSLPVLDCSEGCPEHQRFQHQNLKLALIAAVGRLGGDGAEELLGTILTDPRETPLMRQRAGFALAELGTDHAAELLDGLRSTTQRARWWDPPNASAWLEKARRPPPGEEAATSFEWHQRDQSVLTRWGDRRLLVFPDPAAGGWGDLWISEIQPDGSAGEAVFLGVSFGDTFSMFVGSPVYGRIEDGRLHATFTADGRTAAVDLAEAWSDRDEDGLTDLLEGRFGTDPERADTDEDGIPDPEDLVPQAPGTIALDDEEKIAVAVLDSFFRSRDQWRDGVAFVKADRPLPWTGRTGPTFTVAPERVGELGRQLGGWQSPIFGVHRAGADEVDKESLEHLDLEDGDHLYIISAPQQANFAIVRQVGDRWVVRDIRMWWIA